jgi:hypothetical protein
MRRMDQQWEHATAAPESTPAASPPTGVPGCDYS